MNQVKEGVWKTVNFWKLTSFLLTGVVCLITPAVSADNSDTAYNGIRVITIEVQGVRNSDGNLRAVLCVSDEGFPSQCELRRTVKAKAGTTLVEFSDVQPGLYAFAVMHDENADDRLSMTKYGMPAEGLGYSNDAMGASGPPDFKSSSFEVSKSMELKVKMLYWN